MFASFYGKLFFQGGDPDFGAFRINLHHVLPLGEDRRPVVAWSLIQVASKICLVLRLA